MSQIVKFKNGYEGTVSDEVAIILEKKGEVKILKEAPKPKKSAKSEEKVDDQK